VPANIREEIQFYVQEYHLGASVLKRILRNKYPNQEIYSKDLYKMIHKFKVDVQVKNNAATLYEHLSKLQQENPDWYFKINFEGINNRLFKIFWMLPEQKNQQSHIAATAIVCDETILTYEWILEQTKLATGNL
ncbi:34589_t:CDS:2, partial [Racocetra persica]